MKKTVLSFLFLSLFFFTFPQSQISNPFADVKDWSLQDKPTIIYVFASWCGATIENFVASKDTLLKYRTEYNLVILYDTSNSTFNRLTAKEIFQKADKLISLKSFYPSKLTRLSENKKLTRDFNEVFGSNLFRLGPGTMLYLNEKRQFLSALPIFDREKELSKLFNDR